MRKHCLLLVLRLALACVGMVVGIYPHEVRTLLFAAPLVVIPVGGGIGYLLTARWAGAGAFGFVALVLVFSVPLKGVLDVLARVSRDDDRMRAAMTYLAGHQRNGDRVYAWYTSQYPLAFLLECECLPDILRSGARRWPVEPVEGSSDQWGPALVSRTPSFVIGREVDPRTSEFRRELRQLRGASRVWVVLSALESSDRSRLLRELDTVGRRIQAFDPTSDYEGVDVYLYDLRGAGAPDE